MDKLTDYLNDHLAGSVAALELLDRMLEACAGKPLERFLRELREEIQQDQEQLKELIEKLGASESAVRKAGAWVAEKLTRPRIDLGEGSKEEVGVFLALEALVLGITGNSFLRATTPANGDRIQSAKVRSRLARIGGSSRRSSCNPRPSFAPPRHLR